MKTIIFTLFTVSALLLCGCSKNNQQAFAKRKYMPFFVKHHLEQNFIEKHVEQYAAAETQIPETPDPKSQNPEGEAVQASLPEIAEAVGPDQSAVPVMQPRLIPLQVSPPQARPEIPDVSLQMTEDTQPSRADLVRHISRADDEDAIALILLVILAILLPPLAVLIVDGFSWSFLLSILLWLLFYIPGLIYALFVIFRAE